MKNYLLFFLPVFTIACHNANNENAATDRDTAPADTTQALAFHHPAQTQDTGDTTPSVHCEKTWLTTIEDFKVWKLAQGAIAFKAKMAIDADGSPRAYCPANKGLDYTANAGTPGHWYGIVTDESGEPVVQKDTDPCPGCYVSPTTLFDKTRSKDDPLRYCNSEKIPFIVLPKKVLDVGGIKIGDLAYVFNTGNGKSCFALFADGGPAGKLGEGSIFLAEELGIISNPRTGGTQGGIIYLVFPRSGKGNGYLLSAKEIDQCAAGELQKLGGKEIIACLDL